MPIHESALRKRLIMMIRAALRTLKIVKMIGDTSSCIHLLQVAGKKSAQWPSTSFSLPCHQSSRLQSVQRNVAHRHVMHADAVSIDENLVLRFALYRKVRQRQDPTWEILKWPNKAACALSHLRKLPLHHLIQQSDLQRRAARSAARWSLTYMAKALWKSH